MLDSDLMPSVPAADPAALPSWWWLVATTASGAVLALALALTVATMAEGDDPRPRAVAGDVLDPPYSHEPLPVSGRVVLPWQHLDVAVGTPQGQLPDIGGDPADIGPPEDGAFVRVDARPALDGQIPLVATSRPLQSEVEVVLRADGVEYPLSGGGGLELDPNDPVSGTGGTRWVAVPGEPTDLEVAVLVDGQEQTVHADGTVTARRAAGLKNLPRGATTPEDPIPCGPVRRDDDSPLRVDPEDEPDCHLTSVLRTPFVDGLGWAPAGREYLMVAVSHDEDFRVEGPDGARWEETHQLGASLGGVRPVDGPRNLNALNRGTLAVQDPEDPDQLVFEVPAGGPDQDLAIDLTVEAAPQDPFVSDRDQMQLEWTVPAWRLR